MIETGLSDFHVIIAIALKGSFRKRGPRIITYRIILNLITQFLERNCRKSLPLILIAIKISRMLIEFLKKNAR